MAVTSPDPHGAGSLRNSTWWGTVVHGVLFITQATSKPANSVAGPFTSKAAAQKWLNQQNQQISQRPAIPFVSGWLSGLGGMIGSGIEAGFVSFFKDLWDVIVGPLEVIAGLLLALVFIIWFMKDDITKGASMLAGAAARG